MHEGVIHDCTQIFCIATNRKDKKECAKKYIDALQTERIIIIRLIFLYRNLLTVDDIQTIAVDVCLNTIDSIYSSIL